MCDIHVAHDVECGWFDLPVLDDHDGDCHIEMYVEGRLNDGWTEADLIIDVDCGEVCTMNYAMVF